MRRALQFDLNHRCPECGYPIPPNEILHVDGQNVRCPKCGKDIPYGSDRPISFSAPNKSA